MFPQPAPELLLRMKGAHLWAWTWRLLLTSRMARVKSPWIKTSKQVKTFTRLGCRSGRDCWDYYWTIALRNTGGEKKEDRTVLERQRAQSNFWTLSGPFVLSGMNQSILQQLWNVLWSPQPTMGPTMNQPWVFQPDPLAVFPKGAYRTSCLCLSCPLSTDSESCQDIRLTTSRDQVLPQEWLRGLLDKLPAQAGKGDWEGWCLLFKRSVSLTEQIIMKHRIIKIGKDL